MDESFWMEVWEARRLGFHQPQVNPYLQKFWPQFELSAACGVFVPLCGKSLDLVWLHERGHAPIVGVELSDVAVSQFYDEQGLDPAVETVADRPLIRYTADEIVLYNGNFFDLKPADTAEICAAYDRAALVALPPEMRPAYAAHFARLMPADSQTFLITFAYDQAQMDGPPFSVPEAEVRELYTAEFEIDLLGSRELISKARRMAERGLDSFVQNMYRLRRR